MLNKNPEGYKKLLAYTKAKALHRDTLELASHFPRTKTYADLADQMARSGRSGNKNIVEGWKRNTTKEYFDFLGFSIGAVEELRDDAEDIILGVYPELNPIIGVMGQKGIEMGKERVKRGQKGIMGREVLESLKFYPLNETFPPVVKIYLQAKEVNFLLDKLQKSLDFKMDQELTKPANQKAKSYFDDLKKADRETEEYFKSLGLVRLENGQFMEKSEWEHKGKPPLFPPTP